MRGNGSAAGAPHLCVDIAVEEVVEGVSAAGGEGACNHDHCGQLEAGRTAVGKEHADESGKQEKKDYAGLGEGEIVSESSP